MASSAFRRIGRVALVVVLLLVAALVVLPMLFKDRIEAALKQEASRQVEADVDWSKLHLSFFTAFPNLSAGVDGLTLRNRAPFDSVVLAANKAKEKADEAEQKALAEADAKADALVAEARKQGDALVEAAEQAGEQGP